MKEPNTLPDIQLSLDARGVYLPKVGIRNVILPVRLVMPEGERQLTATASLSISLGAELKGTHMSRLMEILAEVSASPRVSFDFESTLLETCRRLHSDSAYLQIAFTHFLHKTAPVSRLSAPMGYSCSVAARITHGKRAETGVSMVVPIANLCPCSKAISEYGAHNQRGELRIKVTAASNGVLEIQRIEGLISALEEAGSCPVFPLLKRIDEKSVTERQYDNPKFVEDVVRDAVLMLRNCPDIEAFSVEAEAFESIHAHNAWACYEENFPRDLF